MGYIEKRGRAIFEDAGIKVNGSRPWDIHIHNDQFFSRLLKEGTIALGESYVDGWWDCKAIDQMVYRLINAGIVNGKTYSFNHWGASFVDWLRRASTLLRNHQTRKKSAHDVKYHYNLGNDLFEATLDRYMNYSCAYWKNAKTLDQAQKNKMDLICKKLKLKKGMKILDIGCGWGGFAKFAADKYGVEVEGITLSENQLTYAKKYCKGSKVNLFLKDYRDVRGLYDRIVSIEMIEHIGPKNLRDFMKVARICLKKDGLMLLQLDGKSESITWNYSWVDKYLFPGTVTPSVTQIAKAGEDLFYIADLHDFTEDYHKTMMAWHNNFKKNWKKIKKNYDDRFYRFWEFYLRCCPGTALAKTQHAWQIVLARTDSDKQYERV